MEDNIFEQSIMNPTFIFVDGSYYNFYRYFALMQWWKNAYPDEPLDNPYQNEVFVEKFKKTHVENLKQMSKKLKIAKDVTPIMIIGKDCRRENIWRNEFFPQYKANRANGQEDGFMGGPFFKMAYQDNLFEKGGAKAILRHPKLEADDCIALSVKHLLKIYPNCSIYIITSDKDYLQLSCSNVEIYNLYYKKLTDLKSCHGDPKLDLFCKIVSGDLSDNISSVLKRCGEKTAVKYYNNPILFEAKLKEENAEEKYRFNKLLIDFNQIPEQLQDGFIHKYIL
jgi:5'-3' exonuclease